MIPSSRNEDVAQELRGMFSVIVSESDNPPFEILDSGAVKLNPVIFENLEQDIESTKTMMLFGEWFDDMDYMQYRASTHDDSYKKMLFSVLFPQGSEYVVRVFPVDYEQVEKASPSMTVREFFSHIDPDFLEYPVKLFDNDEERRILKKVLLGLMKS